MYLAGLSMVSAGNYRYQLPGKQPSANQQYCTPRVWTMEMEEKNYIAQLQDDT